MNDAPAYECPLILVIEDDLSIQHFLRLSLENEKYKVVTTERGIAGLSLFHAVHPDLLLLDLGLPDIGGIEVLRNVRETDDTPIIVISARGQEGQKITLLDEGADDYIVKPFGIGELLARIRMVLRHAARPANGADDGGELTIGALHVDKARRLVRVDDHAIHFTPIEYRLLLVLIENRGKVLTHRFIQDAVWGHASTDDYQTLRVFMASVRRKLEDDASNPRYITTEVGIGYRFTDEISS